MEFLGNMVSEGIFYLAYVLRDTFVPGLVSLAMVVVLGVFILYLWLESRRKLHALDTLITEITDSKDGHEFHAKIISITQTINSLSDRSGYKQLKTAWAEFKESLLENDDGPEKPYFNNTVRPSVFFNSEDLHYGLGFFRYVPGLFVTVGLFLTFLGLISALNAIQIGVDDTTVEIRTALNNLLGAATAKFIMSLTGLAASIIFTIFMRSISSKVDSKINDLCYRLEERLSFISLEEISKMQLNIAKGYEESFRSIGLELVERIGEPLRNELPEAITSSVENVVKPIMEAIGKSSTESVGELASELSSKLTSEMSQALADTSAQITSAGENIAQVVNRMDGSSSKMGQEMENAVTKLSDAATNFTEAAGNATEASVERINEVADRFLTTMNETLDRFRESSLQSVNSMKIAAELMHETSVRLQEKLNSLTDASDSLTNASNSLAAATVPIQQSIERIDESTSSLSESVRNTSDSLLGSARELMSSSLNTLKTAQNSLNAEQESIQAVLNSLRSVIEQLKGQGEQMDNIDEKLGNALDRLAGNVQNHVDTLQNSVVKIVDTISPAIDRMHQVVEQAENYIPTDRQSQ